MKIFILRWCDDSVEKVCGKDISDAFRNAGYGIVDWCQLEDWIEETEKE